ncbi:MAG: PAS domain S-box protein [Bryobacteraceae bacterium]
MPGRSSTGTQDWWPVSTKVDLMLMNKEQGAMVEALLKNSPLAIVGLDESNRILLWSAAAERLLGWTAEEMKAHPVEELDGSGEAASGLHGYRELRAKGGQLVGVDCSTSPWKLEGAEQAGTIVFLSRSASKGGAAVGAPAASGRKKPGERAQDRFRELLDAAPDSIIEVDSEGRIVLSNVATERMFGYKRGELLGLSLESLIPEGMRTRHVLHRSRYWTHPQTRPMGSGLLLQALRRDGTEFPVEISLSPVKAEEGFRVTAIIRDVTERKRAEEQIRSMHERFTRELTETNRQLEQRNNEVEKANRLKSEFLASMSHELRTPLHTIIGFSELLGEETQGPLNDKQKRFLGHIHRDSLHLLELINDVLDLSRIEAGRLELHCAVFPVGPALEEALLIIRPSAATKEIPMVVDIGEGLTVYADRIRFKEILLNLLSNAVKFTPRGGEITVRGAERPDDVYFSVTDTGIGIAQEDQEAIFDSFYQVGSTTKGIREGTGLGLAIVRHLVAGQGGRIWVESEPGRGSSFQFTLPAGPKMGGTTDEARRAPLVLVAEPEAGARELLAGYLGPQGYRTETASTPAEMMRKARQLKPDAIALDVAIVQGGWRALHSLLAAPETAEIPVVVMSSMDEADSAISLGAAAFLVKPVKKEVFLSTIRKYVEPSPGQVTRILAVDDEPESLSLVQEVLSQGGYVPILARSGREALETLARTDVDLVIIDLIMPEMSGFELILRIKENSRLESLPLVVLTAHDLTEQDYDLLQRKTKAVFLKSSSWREELVHRLNTVLGHD